MHKWLQVNDFCAENILRYLAEAHEFIETAMDSNGRVLVHW